MDRLATPALALSVALAVVGCASEGPAVPRLRVSSAQAAGAVVQRMLGASRGGAMPDARGFCGGAVARARVLARLWPQGAQAGPINVLRAEAAWAGSEPYFRVVFGFAHHGVMDQAELAVRAREGCIDAASMSVAPALAEEDEISL